MHASHTKTEPPAAAGVPSLPSPTVPVPVPHPDLTDEDKERIETWFEHDSRLTEVAQTLGIGVLTLAAWAKQPHIKDALNDIREIAHFRTETLRAEAEHASVNRLLSLVRYSNHEEIARRAAANILGQGLRPGRAANHTTALQPAHRDNITSPSIPTPKVPHFPLPEGGGQGVGSSTSKLQPTQLANQPHGATSQSPSLREGLGWVPNDQKHQQTGATSPTQIAPTPPPPPFPAPLPPAPPPCLSVSVPPCHLPSTLPQSPSLREELGWVPNDQKYQQTGATSPTQIAPTLPPFPVPVPRSALPSAPPREQSAHENAATQPHETRCRSPDQPAVASPPR